MSSNRELRQRIKSIQNISQVTKALETVSATKVKSATKAALNTKPYSEKAWKVLLHLARQPGNKSIHHLLTVRKNINKILIIFITSDRGLNGAYNSNIFKYTFEYFLNTNASRSYITVGGKGRDMLVRRKMKIVADFSELPDNLKFSDISSLGRIAIEEYTNKKADEVYLAYTDFVSLITHKPTIRKLIPLSVEYSDDTDQQYNFTHPTNASFTYEPEQTEILDYIIPRFTAIQIYQAILSARASDQAARMIAMRNATDNALELNAKLQLTYNKARQQSITNDILDIVGGSTVFD